MKDLPNKPIVKDLPAGASAKVRAKPVNDRRQRQLAAWAAAIEDRTDTEAFLEILHMKDPAAAETATHPHRTTPTYPAHYSHPPPQNLLFLSPRVEAVVPVDLRSSYEFVEAAHAHLPPHRANTAVY